MTDPDTSGAVGGTERAPVSRCVPVSVPPCPGQGAVLALQCAVPEVMPTLSPTRDSPAQHLPAVTLWITVKLQQKQPQHPRCLRAGRDFYLLSQDIPHINLSLRSCCFLSLCNDKTKHLYFRALCMCISYLL